MREVGYGLSLEGASSADLTKSKRAKNEPCLALRRRNQPEGHFVHTEREINKVAV